MQDPAALGATGSCHVRPASRGRSRYRTDGRDRPSHEPRRMRMPPRPFEIAGAIILTVVLVALVVVLVSTALAAAA